MVITRGGRDHPLQALEQGARASWFVPNAGPLTARKRWIAGSIAPAGAVVIDEGAAHALAGGRSLLPAGILTVEGEFGAGDAILVRSLDGRVLGRGLTAYGSQDVTILCGRKSADIEALLGYRGRDEIIPRDDLVLG